MTVISVDPKLTHVQQMIETVVLEQHLLEFDEVMNTVFSTWLSHKDYRELPSDFVRRCAVIFASSKNFTTPIIFTHSKMTAAASALALRDGEQLYASCSPEVQRRFLQIPSTYDGNALYVYLFLLTKIGLTGDYYLTDYQESALEEESRSETGLLLDFLKDISDSAESDEHRDELDLSYPTYEFRTSLFEIHSVLWPFSCMKDEMFALLRVVYGEKHYLEITDALFSNGPNYINPACILDMFENWSDWRNYPFDWILETIDNDELCGS